MHEPSFMAINVETGAPREVTPEKVAAGLAIINAAPGTSQQKSLVQVIETLYQVAAHGHMDEVGYTIMTRALNDLSGGLELTKELYESISAAMHEANTVAMNKETLQ